MSVATAGMCGTNRRKSASIIGAAPNKNAQSQLSRSSAPWLNEKSSMATNSNAWLLSDATIEAPVSAPESQTLNSLLHVEAHAPDVLHASPASLPEMQTSKNTAEDIATHILSSSSASGASTPAQHTNHEVEMDEIAHRLNMLDASLQRHADKHLAHSTLNAGADSLQDLSHTVLEIANQVHELRAEHNKLRSGASNNIQLLHDGSINHKDAIESLHQQVSALKAQVQMQHDGLMDHTSHIRSQHELLNTHKRYLSEQHDGLLNHRDALRAHKTKTDAQHDALAAHARILDQHSEHLTSGASGGAGSNLSNEQLQSMQKMVSDIRSMYNDLRQRDQSSKSISTADLRAAVKERRQM